MLTRSCVLEDGTAVEFRSLEASAGTLIAKAGPSPIGGAACLAWSSRAEAQ